MQGMFQTEDICIFISYCRSSFNCKLKKSINKQVIFYNSNAFYSSGECLQTNILKHRSFIGMCSLFNWSNLQLLYISKLNSNEARLFEGSFFIFTLSPSPSYFNNNYSNIIIIFVISFFATGNCKKNPKNQRKEGENSIFSQRFQEFQ